MRWKEPQDGKVRIKRKFLILPLKIELETRWFEVVHIKQKYKSWGVDKGWKNIEWIDKDE